MITAAVTGMQARKLNYVQVEIVPKPSSTGKNGERPFIHMSDVGVQYSTIIFPDKDGKSAPHNIDEDVLESSCGTQEFANHEKSHGSPPSLPRRNDQVTACKHDGMNTPPRRRRAHSSPNAPRSKKISSLDRTEQLEEAGNSDGSYKTRTLPSSEHTWQDDVFTLEIPKNEEPLGGGPPPERVERAKQDTPARKMKKFFRTGRHVSDLGTTHDILQAVQAVQKKVRRKSSGESVESSSERAYSSSSHDFGQVGIENEPRQQSIPTFLRNPPPIPGMTVRNGELEKAANRHKLSRQNSVDQKKMALEQFKEKSTQGQVVAETRNRTKFLQMFPTMKFGKFGSSSRSKEAKQEVKNQLLTKKPVPLPRYNKNHVSPLPSCSESLDSRTALSVSEVLCESRLQGGKQSAKDTEAEMYVNVVFQHREDGHNYENVNLEDKSSPDHPSKYFTRQEFYHHTRPLPAPRLNTPNQPIKDHKATPPDENDEISCSRKKQDVSSPGQTGYEPVSFKPPCLQIVDASFFPKHVGSSFEEDETAGSNDECQSSFDEETASRTKEIDLLAALTLKQDPSLSKEKRGKCEPVPKRNSDGSLRSIPDGWGTSEYAVFQKGDPDEVRSYHHKHIRSHSSGGQLILHSGNMKVLNTGDGMSHSRETGDIHSADVFPNVKMETFKPIQSSPPYLGREKRSPLRNTHEHVTLGQHVHSNLHSGQSGGTSKELKSKYLDDAPCLQRTPQHGSPSTQGQSPWWDDNGEEEQLEEKPIPSYIHQPWYYGKLLRQECDYLMMSKGKPCQYLVRDSSHRAGGLMLCVLFGQKVHHYIIHVLSNTEYQMAGHTFGSVSDIIEFYRKHVIMYSPNQEPVFLGEPFLYPR